MWRRTGALSIVVKERLDRRSNDTPTIGNVLAPNPRFAGRQSELRALHEAVTLGPTGTIAVVQGLGGIGKTAIATQYAYSFAHHYGGGSWQVQCEGIADLDAGLASLAPCLGVEFEPYELLDPSLQAERVVAQLESQARTAPYSPYTLLLLDNVDRKSLLDSAKLRRCVSSERSHVIATTRLSDDELLAGYVSCVVIAIDELQEDEALQVIANYQPGQDFATPRDEEDARVIVRLLGGFALAIELAAIHLARFRGVVTYAGLRTHLAEAGLSGLEAAVDSAGSSVLHGQTALTATLEPTLSRLGEEEQRVLELAAAFPQDLIGLPWIRVLASEAFPELATDAPPGIPDPWLEVLRRLFGLRLLRLGPGPSNGETRIASMHRLVRAAVSVRSGRATREELRAYALASAKDYGRRWFRCEDRWERCIHLAMAKRLLREKDEAAPRYVQATCDWNIEYDSTGPNTLELLRASISLLERRMTDRESELSVALRHLSMVLKKAARYEEAEAMARRSVDIADNLGENEVATLGFALSGPGRGLLGDQPPEGSRALPAASPRSSVRIHRRRASGDNGHPCLLGAGLEWHKPPRGGANRSAKGSLQHQVHTA